MGDKRGRRQSAEIGLTREVATMANTVALRGATPIDARDSSDEDQLQHDGFHGGDPGAAGLSEFCNDDRRRPGLKVRFFDLDAAAIVGEKALVTAAWLRFCSADYTVNRRSVHWRDHHKNNKVLQGFDCHAEKTRRVDIKSGSECNACRVFHSFNT